LYYIYVGHFPLSQVHLMYTFSGIGSTLVFWCDW